MEDKLITVLTFNSIHELALVQGRLESEEIECFVQDELTVQVTPFPNAIGGIKLQVRESDIERTVAILNEIGYITDNDLQPLFDKFTKIERLTSRIPIIRKMRFELRLIVVLVIFAILATGIIIYIIFPFQYQFERLTENSWCVDYVTYEGKEYMPQTENVRRVGINGICEERMTFYKEGRVMMPGFQTNSIHGEWFLENDSLHISNIDTFANVYNGAYEVIFSRNGLILKSEKTTVYCFSEPLNTLFQSDEMWEKYRK